MKTPKLSPVPANAVRVWSGFSAAGSTPSKFLSQLGTVFIPATALMQIQCGLNAYLPSITAGLQDKPGAVPDETALIFWDSQATYYNAFNTLAARTYTLTHGGVYSPESAAAFPTVFKGEVTEAKPVLLFDKPADWMHGFVQHLVGIPSVAPAGFAGKVSEVLTQIQQAGKLDGAIALVGEGYLLYWELIQQAAGGPTPPSGIPMLADLLGWHRVFAPAPTFLPISLWDEWAGMSVSGGSSFNLQFERPA
jgi:hypothetical protein